MNVFEDLIEELKEENLLEETVIETNGRARNFQKADPNPIPHSEIDGGFAGFHDVSAEAADAAVPVIPFVTPCESIPEVPIPFDDPTFEMASLQTGPLADDGEGQFIALSVESPVAPDGLPIAAVPEPVPTPVTFSLASGNHMPANLAPPVGRSSFADNSGSNIGTDSKRPILNHKEYFKKRAIDEVTGLQMVDHVLSGVEREQMRIVPKPFDDIPVKKALHDFMQVSGDTKSTEHARAEFQLMQETESWYSSLSHRDRHVSVAHLRRYCETTKPALSPQALISMGRFYRNSPFSEPVRNKFDLVLTRLFSSESDDERRELLFPRDEIVAQIKDLYADWSSIQLYTAAEDDSEILIAVMKFQDFVTDAEATPTFDELIGNDFFNRLRMFKESLHENFFAPLITVASIESNIKIGNRYIELIQKERNGANAADLQEKYGFLHDQAISDSTAKTFHLVDLLKERSRADSQTDLVEVRANSGERPLKRRKEKKAKHALWGVNKWLLGFTIFVVVACAGIYFWAEQQSSELASTQSPSVKRVNIENSSLKETLQSARINEETFYGITLESWTNLTLEKKEELLKKILSIGPEKGFKKVHLLNDKGRAVGFASDAKVEVYNP
jgi:hypothetical protein